MFLFSDDPLFTDEELFLMCAASGRKTVQDTATGNPLVFTTDLARPLKSLLIPFTPVQSGTGDPSPQNIRPLVPWNGLTVFGGGKNLFNKDDPNIQLDKRIATGGTIINSQYGQAVTGFIPVKEGAKYIINKLINPNYFSCFYSEKDITKPVGEIFGNNEFPKIAPNGAKYLIVTIGNNVIDDFQIEAGQTATAYEPYKPITETDISFPSPVYGGTLDVVSGVLTVEWVEKVYTGAQDELWNTESVTAGRNFYIATPSEWKRNTSYGDLLCNVGKVSDNLSANVVRISTTGNLNACIGDAIGISTVADFRTWLSTNNMQVAVKLATPSEIELTPTQLTALVGDNTIWSDADGQMTAVYLKKG